MSSVVLYKQPKLLDYVSVCVDLCVDEREQYEAFTGMKFDAETVAAYRAVTPGPSWLICADEKPIAVAGFDMLRPGVWQDWMFSTPAAWDQHWRSVTKYAKRVMDAMLKTEAHRLQCISLASRIHAHKWYGALGLELEGRLDSYGVNGEDALMFRRLRVET